MKRLNKPWLDSKFCAFDFETSGALPEFALQPWRIRSDDAWATSVVLTHQTDTDLEHKGSMFPSQNKIAKLLQFAIDNDMTVVCWNALYDTAVCLAYGLDDLVFRVKWLDGMLLWRHYIIEPEYDQTVFKKKSYGLKACVAEFLPEYAGYEDDIDYHSTDPKELAKLHEYNKRDTTFTLWLSRHFYRLLENNPQQLNAALIEADCLPMVAQANVNGILIDRLRSAELTGLLHATSQQCLKELAPHGVTEAVVRSPTKLAALLFDQWKLPVLKENRGKKTQKISRATDKEVLHELAFKDPRAKRLREYRESLNNVTKFTLAPATASRYCGDGRAHPEAHVFGTYSGRLTYSSSQGKGKAKRQTGWALHQMKNDRAFRAQAIAPNGYTLVEFDAAGQEFRWMAIASGDETMLSLCAPGEDPHSYMAARIARDDYRTFLTQRAAGDKSTEPKRKLGKVANLSLQYRTSAKKLRVVARVQYDLPMDLSEATYIHKTYQESYPGVPQYWAHQMFDTRKSGYVETFAGRRVYVIGNWDGNFGWSMGSTAINYRIQGTGADQKYLAMAVIKNYVRAHGAYFAWDLHDGIYFWVPTPKVHTFIKQVKYALDNLPYAKAWNFTPTIPLPWDAKFGPSWGQLQEFKE